MSNKKNMWLEDEQFLANIGFHDIYYLTSLGRYISNFIKNVPVPPITWLDKKNMRIYFMVGSNQYWFKIDTNIAYYDFLELIKQWLVQFYPQYDVIVENTRKLTEEEIIARKEYAEIKGIPFDLNDALEEEISFSYNEHGIIIKIFMKEDNFIINVNGKKYLRKSGSEKNLMPLSTFLPKLRSIEDDDEKRDFIFTNSKLEKELDAFNKFIIIDYSGIRMLNFFKINFDRLKHGEFKKIDDYNYVNNNYKIHFENKILKEDCFFYFYNRLENEKNGVFENDEFINYDL